MQIGVNGIRGKVDTKGDIIKGRNMGRRTYALWSDSIPRQMAAGYAVA